MTMKPTPHKKNKVLSVNRSCSLLRTPWVQFSIQWNYKSTFFQRVARLGTKKGIIWCEWLIRICARVSWWAVLSYCLSLIFIFILIFSYKLGQAFEAGMLAANPITSAVVEPLGGTQSMPKLPGDSIVPPSNPGSPEGATGWRDYFTSDVVAQIAYELSVLYLEWFVLELALQYLVPSGM